MKIINSNKQGYTLLELIVSMSIITLLTGLFLANYHNSNQRTDLVMTAQTMVADFRYAQANALGLVKYDGESPAGGWGILVTSDPSQYHNYFIFADQNDDGYYNDNESLESLGGRVITLPKNIYIESLTLDGVDKAKAVVTFLPPDPITRIHAYNATGTVLEIKLKELVNNTTKTVRVNFLGLVEVID
ncbi:MAG: prepilin-type N-terminal cleavage/methylation domain-containing protein [bacterium]|nr:prepilin-type N-terminal cleavage/methylation domain-containing protein [bacterium]